MVIHKTYRFFVAILILGIGAWVFVANPTKIIEKLTLAEVSQSAFALIYIAEQRGYFADERLEISYKSYSSGRDALKAALAGEADIATTNDTPVVLQSMAGQEISVITELYSSSKNTALVARKDRGIVTPRDLRGKRVGVSLNTKAEFFLGVFLGSEGLAPDEITIVDMRPDQMAANLREGFVDAVVAWNPHLYATVRALPENQTTIFASDVYKEVSVLAGRKQVIDERSVAFKRLLTALERADHFLQEQPRIAQAIVSAHLSGQSSEMMADTWDVAAKNLALSNVLLDVFISQASWFRTQGRNESEIPDFTAVIDPEYLEGVSPGNVTILN